MNLNTQRNYFIVGTIIFIIIVILGLVAYKNRPNFYPETENINNIFVNIPQELLKKNPDILLEPTAGYFIIASIVSHQKDKVVYAQISDCIRDENDYDDATSCNWNYRVFIKDIQTGKIQNIYSYPEEISFGIKKVHAGGCPIVYIPIAWSKNDQKIILQWINPTSCGSEGAPKYLTYTINSAGGEIENLSTYQPKFLNEYEKVVYLDESPLSPPVCGPVTQANSGKIVFTHIESGEALTLLEEPNSEYSLQSVDIEQSTVIYLVRKVVDVNGCSVPDMSKEETTGILQIP